MQREHATRTLILLGILSALIFIGEKLWTIISNISDLVLIFAMAWLLAFTLGPIARWMDRGLVPASVIRLVRQRWGERRAELLASLRIPYGIAAVLLYLLLLFTLSLLAVILVPAIIAQLIELANLAPDYARRIPDWWLGIEDELVARFNVDRAMLARLIPLDEVVRRATVTIPALLQNVITFVQGIVTGVANTLLVLVLSLYIMLDGHRLSRQFYDLVPIRYQSEVRFLALTLDRTFGGFLRGQVLMALLYGVVAGLVMRIAGLDFTIIGGVLSGFLMFIPELGAPLANLLPALIAWLQKPNTALPVFLILFAYQQVLLRVILPKVMSEMLGMPPLLILAALLLSARVMGFWGFVFGIPLSGAIYSVGLVLLGRWKRAQDAWDRELRVMAKAQKQQPPTQQPTQQPMEEP
ncbi:MAG: AI-2E family transporter [Chloroflexi bacterium]|nr:MAG: AI-2E family transporter [Chloroflexota bacterium]